MRRNSERFEREADRFLEVEDMLMPLSAEGGSLEDIAGLHEVKQILREAVVMPMQYPQLFQGIIAITDMMIIIIIIIFNYYYFFLLWKGHKNFLLFAYFSLPLS